MKANARATLITLIGGYVMLGFIAAQKSDVVPSGITSMSSSHNALLPHNANSCVSCHQAPSLGGSSRVTVVRAGKREAGRYYAHGEAGVLHEFGETVEKQPTITGKRVAINLLGDGYIETIPEAKIKRLSVSQATETHGVIHGQYAAVHPLGSRGSEVSVGRFGWKAQHATVLSAAAEALYSEIGVPNAYFPITKEKRVLGESSSDEDKELKSMVEFLRSTEPIAPDPERSATMSSHAGSDLFDKVGCSICHVRTLKTAPAGTKVAGGQVNTKARLGNREIHPFSDFLLHDVGTGDGIIQNVLPQDYDESTANKFRTAPLWGVRYRSWLMHDGKSVTYHQAIMRHAGEASEVVRRYQELTPIQKEQLRQFLDSL